ncbi:DMT family transporter [Sphingomonas jatrophae]|uniref:EamA-like transporter family protein n=1 Tax=Sphingomonas jatrophae TaxID=1166337 RepID=A0A1I6L4U5_9SPHN|nr:DMT family transporter [Sphingomonas jatrophae]SFR98437.1 EamA-like transporter family protein [Sphingomonas jatrophae]
MSGLAGAPPLSARARLRAAAPFTIVTLIWSSTWLVIRHQLGDVPAEWSVAWRFVVGAVAMAAIVAATRAPFQLPAAGHAVALGVGLFHFAANFQFVYRAEGLIASGLVAVLFALLLVPNALLGRLVLGQRLSRPFLIGSGVAMAGIALLFAHEAARDPSGTGTTLAGVGLTLIAVLCASVANILQATERARRVAGASLLFWAMTYGAVADAAFAWMVAGPPRIDWSAGYIGGVLYLGVIGSAVTFPLYLHVIRTIGPARAAYSSVLIPVLAMALSTLFEGYRWSVEAAAGGLLTLAGLALALRARG